MKFFPICLSILLIGASCLSKKSNDQVESPISLTVLGIAQDAGFPQINCKKTCCQSVWQEHSARQMVSSLGLSDATQGQCWLFDATPDIKDQLYHLQYQTSKNSLQLSGIFLTHAHMGHYTGLMELGREAMGAVKVPVYAMPRMTAFLKNNGPWSQLVGIENIQLAQLKADSVIVLNQNLTVMPLEVPHRDEFSETVGYLIRSKKKSALFIPDIDKWQRWQRDILEIIRSVDYAFLDGTFYRNGEIWGRDMSQIPHPFIEESIALFSKLSPENKAKVHFIHLNHTNPLLQANSEARKRVLEAGFNIAKEFSQFSL